MAKSQEVVNRAHPLRLRHAKILAFAQQLAPHELGEHPPEAESGLRLNVRNRCRACFSGHERLAPA